MPHRRVVPSSPSSSPRWCCLFIILRTVVSGSLGMEGMTSEMKMEGSPFRIVIDGGSTGSRLHIFEFVNDNESNETECVGRGSSSVWTPLSAFARTPSQAHLPLSASTVAEHLYPLFTYAAEVIPAEYHSSTMVTYQATAGMRLLEESEQAAVYDALYEGLAQWPSFVFTALQRQNIATLDGEDEAYFAAVAANYLQGVVTADLQKHNEKQKEVVGALDMGGSSTQIVFSHKHDSQQNTCTPQKNAAQNLKCSSKLDETHFFSTSYLSYGAEQMRFRLWDTWIHDQQQLQSSSSNDDAECAAPLIDNPCAFPGHQSQYKQYTFHGTGDAQQCAIQINRLIPHHDQALSHDHTQNNDDVTNTLTHNKVGGIQHPPIQGKFYAMSLYFFALDCLRQLSSLKNNSTSSSQKKIDKAHEQLNLSWPTPTLDELANALDGLCSRSWHNDLELIQHNAHKYTRAEILPHRCFEAVYIVTLLRDGFGFDVHSRDITFAHTLDGNEVEWSLGMALTLYAKDDHHAHFSASIFDVAGKEEDALIKAEQKDIEEVTNDENKELRITTTSTTTNNNNNFYSPNNSNMTKDQSRDNMLLSQISLQDILYTASKSLYQKLKSAMM